MAGISFSFPRTETCESHPCLVLGSFYPQNPVRALRQSSPKSHASPLLPPSSTTRSKVTSEPSIDGVRKSTHGLLTLLFSRVVALRIRFTHTLMFSQLLLS